MKRHLLKDALSASLGSPDTAEQSGIAVPRKTRDFVLTHRAKIALVLATFGYYFGAKIGFALTFQPHPVSTLWPPNSILLSALLLVPTRFWWILIAAALPAHLAAQVQSNVPPLMILCWFISNSFEALIGAGLIRRLLGESLRFDSFRDVSVFLLCAAFFGPFLSSFLDAGFVILNQWGSGSYWQIWRMRFFANVLATLTLVPVIVSWATGQISSLRKQSGWHFVEAGFIVLGLLIVNIIVFNKYQAGSQANHVLLYAPLPFLLWATVRFGAGETSTLILLIAINAIWGAIHGRGPFASSSAEENALSIQLFLIVISVPLMYLGAVLQERKRTEEAARQNEERLSLALRSAKMGTWDWDMNTQQNTWSDESRRILGMTQEPAEVTLDMFLSCVHPQDREMVSHAIARAIQAGSPYEVEFRVGQLDGEIRWVMGRGEVLYDESGKPARMLGVNLDITDRKGAESALRISEVEAHEQRQQLAHLTRVSILGELSGALAHELNQPLTAILSNAQAAQRFLAKDSVSLDEVREILRDIVAEDIRAGNVIQRLRALLRKEEGKFQPVDLNDVTREAFGLAHSELISRNVSVKMKLAPALPEVRGDRVQLQQVLLNLIINASEAMNAMEPVMRQLTVVTQPNSDRTVHVSVADVGPGIPAEPVDRVFEPFFTTKQQGLGLGLAICRSIVIAHGGQLWAANNPDRGATFHFALPAHIPA